jgi:hypothetical protein
MFCTRFWLVCIFSRLVETAYKLKNDSKAVLPEGNPSSVVHIPASANVVVLEGDMERDRFVQIRYQGNTLLMLSEDLRRGIGLVPNDSRS